MVRVYYARKVRGALAPNGATRMGDRAQVALVAVALGLLALYALGLLPDVLALPLPDPVRWAGASLFAAGVVVVWWAHHSLGRAWSVMSDVREGQSVVTSGPYRYVRHPMYSGIFLTGIGALLLTADLLAGGIYLAAVTVMYAARVGREERSLEEAFGDAYRDAFSDKPRLVPRPRSFRR